MHSLPPVGNPLRDQVLFETKIIGNLPKHPNLVRYLGFRTLTTHVFIGMELCGGTLPNYLASTGYTAHPVHARSIKRWKMVEQFALGLAIVHRHNIIHRDLKPDNSKTVSQFIY